MHGSARDLFVSLYDGARGVGYKGQYSEGAGNWSTQGPDDSAGSYARFAPSVPARQPVPLAPWVSVVPASMLWVVAVRRPPAF
mgnify:FL=1